MTHSCSGCSVTLYASSGNKTEALKILDQLKELSTAALRLQLIALLLFISHSTTKKRRFAGSNKAIKIAPAADIGLDQS